MLIFIITAHHDAVNVTGLPPFESDQVDNILDESKYYLSDFDCLPVLFFCVFCGCHFLVVFPVSD